jgi:predicted GNAT family acetyltransferase
MYNGNRAPVSFACLTGLEIDSVYTLYGHERQGHARAVLKAVCLDADREKVNVSITVKPDCPDFFRELLLNFGFVNTSDDSRFMRHFYKI